MILSNVRMALKKKQYVRVSVVIRIVNDARDATESIEELKKCGWEWGDVRR